MNNPICNCGTAIQTPHETSTHGCQRFVVKAPVLVGKHPELGCEMWDTGDGEPITDYTLYSQRGYHKHEDGVWTRWEGSENSISA